LNIPHLPFASYDNIAKPKTAAITLPIGTTNLSSIAALLGAIVDASILVAVTIVLDPLVAPIAGPVAVRDAVEPPLPAAPVSNTQFTKSIM
jgi:hypothetical protein